MNKKALFCDGTSQYVNPSEPEHNEEVVFRFRTAKDDAEHVCLVQEKIRYEMEKAQTGEVFDYYEIKRQLGEEPFRYYFEIQAAVKYAIITGAECQSEWCQTMIM